MNDSSSFARTLSRIAAGIFALIFAATLPLTLVALAWGQVLFSSDHMTEIFADELVHSGALQEVAVEVLLEQVPRGGQGSEAGILDYLGRQRLEEILRALLPDEWAQSQVAYNIDALYDWIDNDQVAPALALDIQPLKDRLLSGGAEELATTVVSSWPMCGREQEQVLRRNGVPQGELPAFLCQPSDQLRDTMIAVATDLVLRQVTEIPSIITFGEDGTRQTPPQNFIEFKRNLRTLRAFSGAGWLLPLSMLGLIVAVAVRSWSQLLRWWGGAILAAGIGTFLMLATVEGTVEQARNSEPVRTAFPGPFQPILQDVVDQLLDAVSGNLFVLGLLVVAIGLVMLLVGIYLGRRESALKLTGSG